MKKQKLLFVLIFSIFTINLYSQDAGVEGCVAHGISGLTLEGATLSCGAYFSITGADGYYAFSLDPGNYTLSCVYGDLCPFDTTLNLSQGEFITLNIQLFPCPEFVVNPMSVVQQVPMGEQFTDTLTLSNPGVTGVEWSANLEIFSNQKDFLDAQFQYPFSGTSGSSGIECDGEYFYVSNILNGMITKYGLDGTFIETIIIGGVSGIYDMAYNGTYFYGGNGNTIVFEMDFNAQALVSTISAPQNVNAIAYNEDEDVFYGYSWGADIITFDQSGALIASNPVGPSGAIYSGLAYDNISPGNPYLWGYGLVGTDPNTLVQISLINMNEVMTVGLGDLLPDPISNGAGGLFAHADIIENTWTLGGLIQDEWIWGLELASTESWISMSPESGVVGPGENEKMILLFDAASLLPGWYSAIVNFVTIPDVGSPQVPVDLYVFSDEFFPPDNFEVSLQCEAMEVCWSVQNPTVDSFSVYINSQWITNTINYCYTIAGPDQYSFYVTAWYDGEETMPSAIIDFLIPWPSDSEPDNFVIDSLINTNVYLSWSEPLGCAVQDGYNLYRDGAKINDELIVDLFYDDIVGLPGPHEYYSTTVYYFGESGPSNSQTAVITSIPEIDNSPVSIFPNPSTEKMYIHSDSRILFISISDILGQEVYSNMVNEKDIVVDVLTFQKGIYFVRMDMEGNSIMKKILVE